MTELRGPLRDLLSDPIEHEKLEGIRRRMHATRWLPRERAWRIAPALAAAAVVVVGVVSWWSVAPAPDSGPLRLARDGSPLRSVHGGAELEEHALHDGSVLFVARDTRVEAIENGDARVVLAQGDGRAEYHVRPGGPRRWTVDAGALVVDVVGTRFAIVRDGARVRVEVREGRVRVRGVGLAGGLRTLGAGEHVEVGTEEPSPEPPPVPVEAAASAPAEPTGPRAAPAPRPRWRELADRGAYTEACAAIGERGLRDASRRAHTVDELWALADTARLSGHPALAVEPLTRLAEHDAPDARAGIAALTLGRLSLDALDAPGEAVRWLERAVALGVPERLREPTLARLVEAHRRAGNGTQMASTGARYLESYPDGRNAARVRAWLESVR
jgi:transmembrane sensor